MSQGQSEVVVAVAAGSTNTLSSEAQSSSHHRRAHSGHTSNHYGDDTMASSSMTQIEYEEDDKNSAHVRLKELFPHFNLQLSRFRRVNLHPRSRLKDTTRLFYQRQNDFLDELEERGRLISGNAPPSHGPSMADSTAIKLSLLANIVITAGKAYAAGQSGSISIIASLLDSVLDLMSSLMLAAIARFTGKSDPLSYPTGKTRSEPLGVVVFSVMMGMVSLQVLLEAARRLAAKHAESALSVPDVIIMATVVIVKAILWMICRRFQSPSIRALAEDHRNDTLTNGLALIAAGVATVSPSKLWFIDPCGALIMSVILLYNWAVTGAENARTIVGRSANPAFLQQVTFIACSHRPDIVQEIDTVRAFHFGNNFLVEVDIVLPADLPLREAHDIGEELQIKLERLPECERCFVHLDFETTHNPHSEHKQV